ncbi:MAG: hypothetical protein GY702_28030 [Desulfobulbaceae bacterium]|nr:hypothetical protein [Desulfobulbaceae bacterium]
MRKTLIRLFIVWFILCIPQLLGWRGPATRAVLSNSIRYDPDYSEPVRAFLFKDTVYMEYTMEEIAGPYQMKFSNSYWAKISMDSVNGVSEGLWEIYRTSEAPIKSLESKSVISIHHFDEFDIPPKDQFLNRASLLTYVVDQYNLAKPVILLDDSSKSKIFSFHLVGTRKLHDSYKGHWNTPRGYFTYRPEFWKNAWKLPFSCVLDYPADFIGSRIRFPH